MAYIDICLKAPSENALLAKLKVITVRKSKPVKVTEEVDDGEGGTVTIKTVEREEYDYPLLVRRNEETNKAELATGDHMFAQKGLNTLYNDDAVINGQGDIVTPATPKNGWHCDLLVDENETEVIAALHATGYVEEEIEDRQHRWFGV